MENLRHTIVSVNLAMAARMTEGKGTIESLDTGISGAVPWSGFRGWASHDYFDSRSGLRGLYGAGPERRSHDPAGSIKECAVSWPSVLNSLGGWPHVEAPSSDCGSMSAVWRRRVPAAYAALAVRSLFLRRNAAQLDAPHRELVPIQELNRIHAAIPAPAPPTRNLPLKRFIEQIVERPDEIESDWRAGKLDITLARLTEALDLEAPHAKPLPRFRQQFVSTRSETKWERLTTIFKFVHLLRHYWK